MELTFGSIREIRCRLISEGIHISEYMLRTWVKEGTLPARYSGRKAVISYDSVLALLRSSGTTLDSL